MPRFQNGYLTIRHKKYVGNFNKWLVDPTTGKKRRIQKAFTIGPSSMPKNEAKKILRTRIEQELGLRSDNEVTLQYFIETRWKPLHEGQWKPSTKEINEVFLRHIATRWGSTVITAFDTVELQAWLNSLTTYSGSFVKHIRHLLRSIFIEAQEQEYTHRNPARLLRLPKVRPVKRPYLKIEQVKHLIKNAEIRDRVLLQLLLLTALRPSELFALRWRHFRPTERVLMIVESVYRGELRDFTKTTNAESPRALLRVFLTDEMVKTLTEWRAMPRSTKDGGLVLRDKEDDFIFPNVYGGFYRKENYTNRILKVLGKRAGISKINFQILRRTVATHLQRVGSPQDIASVMRHTNPSTAAHTYTQKMESSVRDAIERLAEKLTD